MAVIQDIYLSHNIETKAFEVTTVDRYGRCAGEPHTRVFEKPCNLILSVEDGAARLHIAEAGEIGGYGFMDLDHDQAMIVYQGLHLAVAAQQTFAEEPSDTMKAFTRLGGNITGFVT